LFVTISDNAAELKIDPKDISLTQIYNYIKNSCRKFKAKYYLNNTDELMKLYKDYFLDVENYGDMTNKPFIISPQSTPTYFRFFCTSKNLLQNYLKHLEDMKSASTGGILFLDTTYKVSFSNIKLTIVGTQTKHHRFQPICFSFFTGNENADEYEYCLTNMINVYKTLYGLEIQPEYIMADFAPYISLAISRIFPLAKKLFCYYHLKANITKRASGLNLNKDIKNSILGDLTTLSNSFSNDIFALGVNLFLEKYEIEEDFCTYFYNNYIEKNDSWYIGASPVYVGKTNNLVESFNSTIKRCITKSKLLPFPKFLEKFFTFVEHYSPWYTSSPDINKKVIKQWKISLKYEAYEVLESEKYISYIHPTIYDKHGKDINLLFKKEFNNVKAFKTFSNLLSLPRVCKTTRLCSCRFFNTQGCCAHVLRYQLDKSIFIFNLGEI
jgi:hypothetical protein